MCKSKRSFNKLILAALLMLFSVVFHSNDAEAASLTATAAFKDTKSVTKETVCRGNYYVYDSYNPETDDASLISAHVTDINPHFEYNGYTYYNNHVSDHIPSVVDSYTFTKGDGETVTRTKSSDDYGLYLVPVEWRCYVYYGYADQLYDSARWILDYGVRYGWRTTKCDTCGATNKNKYKGAAMKYLDYCPKGSYHFLIGNFDGTVSCSHCKQVAGNSSYFGACDQKVTATMNVEWESEINYINPQGIEQTESLEGGDSKMVIVKYESSPDLIVNITSKYADGGVVGYKVYVDGELKTTGGTENEDDRYTSFSQVRYSCDAIDNMTEVQFVLHTNAGTYTLPVVTLVPRFYWLEYDLADGGIPIDGATSIDMSSGGDAEITNAPRLGCYSVPVTIPNPTRPGFKFLGWMIEGMDDGSVAYEEIDSHYHYWSTGTASTSTTDYRTQAVAVSGDISSGLSAFIGKENVTYVPAEYTSFLNLRVDIGQTVRFTALWVDNGAASDPTEDIDPDPDRDPSIGNQFSEFGFTYTNKVDDTNNDEELKLATQTEAYIVNRTDGTSLTTSIVTMDEQYQNVFSTLYQGLSGSGLSYQTTYVTHTHTGDPTNGGGCYGKKSYHQHDNDCYTSSVHMHTGDSINGDGCYTVRLTHEHEGNYSEAGGCHTVPFYHAHSGNEVDGGICYTEVVHTHTSSCQETCTIVLVDSNDGSGKTCTNHGVVESDGDICGSVDYTCGKTTYTLSCGKTESDIAGYSIMNP